MTEHQNEALLAAYVAHLRLRGRAATAAKYVVTLQRYARHCAATGFATASASEIERFLLEERSAFLARHGRPPSANTNRNSVTALKGLYGYLDLFDLLRDASGVPLRNPMKSIESIRVRRCVRPWL